MTLLLNRELVSRVKLCLVSAFPDIIKQNLPKIVLRSFENVDPNSLMLCRFGMSPGLVLLQRLLLLSVRRRKAHRVGISYMFRNGREPCQHQRSAGDEIRSQHIVR